MITSHYFKYTKDSYNNLISIDLVKCIKEDNGTLIAEINVNPNEFALSLSELEVLDLLLEAKSEIISELDRMTAYDVESTSPTKGLSSPAYGPVIGKLVSTILEVGAYSASRPTE